MPQNSDTYNKWYHTGMTFYARIMIFPSLVVNNPYNCHLKVIRWMPTLVGTVRKGTKEVSTVSTRRCWPPKGWWEIALSSLPWCITIFSAAFFKMLLSEIHVVEKIPLWLRNALDRAAVLYPANITWIFTLGSENCFPVKILKCLT